MGHIDLFLDLNLSRQLKALGSQPAGGLGLPAAPASGSALRGQAGGGVGTRYGFAAVARWFCF